MCTSVLELSSSSWIEAHSVSRRDFCLRVSEAEGPLAVHSGTQIASPAWQQLLLQIHPIARRSCGAAQAGLEGQ